MRDRSVMLAMIIQRRHALHCCRSCKSRGNLYYYMRMFTASVMIASSGSCIHNHFVRGTRYRELSSQYGTVAAYTPVRRTDVPVRRYGVHELQVLCRSTVLCTDYM